ncbi:MAG TPA: helix-hairpin-helix domain-containing protein [Candidatus Omnitrophota bacterium]|nr:helix-hairpin-helix domain-containing protein [Candidatus Omnitrophota bacterium]HPN88230.1 helix-hairpin-helix domain-containing protein [Candidatus Omnitrophota bacterium]
MFYLTQQERMVVLALAFVLFFGAMTKYAFQKYPHIKDLVNFADSDFAYEKIDVNTATAEELEAIPYIGKMTAKNIIDFREKNGAFTSIEQLKNVKGIRDKNYAIFSKYIFVKEFKRFVDGSRKGI